MLSRRTLIAAGGGALLLPAIGTARAAGRPGGTLVLATDQEPRHFNGAIQSGVATALPCTQIFASPLRYDANWNPQPYLAKAWTVSPDGLMVTLTLVDNALFHDGERVTSEDVAFTIGIIKANHPFTTMLAPVASVDTPDATTVVIHLSHPHPALLLAMSPALMPILPKHIYGQGPIQQNPANLKPIGSGPFRFVEFNRGQDWIVEKFDKFFMPGRPMLDRIVARLITDPNVTMVGLERGELHLVPGLTNIRDIARAQAAPNLQMTDKGSAGIGPITWIDINCGKPPLDDVRVRQAICFAADKYFIQQKLLSGKMRVATGPIFSASPFYTAEVEPYHVDLARAEKLLDEAGHPRGGDGVRFPLTVDYGPGSPEQGRNIAEYLRPQLKKIGIEVTTRAAPDFPTWAQRVANFDYELSMDQVFNWGDPTIGVARSYLSSNIRKGVVWANMSQYRNPKVDELLNAAAVELDPAKRKALYGQFQTIVVNEAPIHFLDEVTSWTAAKKGLVNLPLTIWGSLSPLDELAWENPSG